MAVGQKYTVAIKVENGSGHSLVITPRDFIGDPSIGQIFAAGNKKPSALLDGRDEFLAWVTGPVQPVKIGFDLTDHDLTDGTADDLGHFFSFTGAYVADIGMPGNEGSQPTFKTTVTRTVNGRIATRVVGQCVGDIDSKTGAERNTHTVTIDGYVPTDS